MRDETLYSSLSAFFGDFAVMLDSSMTLEEIVTGLANDAKKSWKGDLEKIAEEMSKGKSFGDALDESSRFPSYAKRMVHAGETSGRLEESCIALSDFYEKRDRQLNLIKNALVQPITLLFFLSVIIAAFISFVLPVITNVYISMGGIRSSFIFAGYVIGIISFLCVFVAFVLLLGARGKMRREGFENVKFLGRNKAMNNILKITDMAFFMNMYYSLLEGGIISDFAFEEAASKVLDDELRKKLLGVSKRLFNGDDLLTAIKESMVLSRTHLHTLGIGIRNGRLSKAARDISDDLFETASIYLDENIKEIEPLLTSFFTLAVGLSLLSVMLPLIGIITSIG